MGQKSQLIWDLPPAETYALNRAVFDVPQDQFDKTLEELTELLELGPLLDKPTRQLSLGERMKCELAAALLHRPTTLFLDEPTIGLDVAMQVAIRDFVRSYNQRHEATVLLTSHYMDDVVALCPRDHRDRSGQADPRRRPARADQADGSRQARVVHAGRRTVVRRGHREARHA